MNREQKKAFVAEASDIFGGASVVLVTQYQGLTVAEMTDLRRKVRENGAHFKVMKNRLAKLALKGTQYEKLIELMVGPTAVATSSDPVTVAKVLAAFAKDKEKFQLIGGAFGSHILDKSGIEELSKLPSLDEIRAKLVGMLQTPATRIASVLQAPGGQLARVFSAYSNKAA